MRQRLAMVVAGTAALAGCNSQSADAGNSNIQKPAAEAQSLDCVNDGKPEENDPNIRKGRFRTCKPLQSVILTNDGVHGNGGPITPERGYPDQNAHQSIASFATHWMRDALVSEGSDAIFTAARDDELALECNMNPGRATLILGEGSAYFNGPVPIKKGSWSQSGRPYNLFIDVDFKKGRYVLKNSQGQPISDTDGRISRLIESGSDYYVCFDHILSPFRTVAALDGVSVPTNYTYCAFGFDPNTNEIMRVTSDVPTVKLNGSGTNTTKEFSDSVAPVSISLDSGICRSVK